MATPHALTSVRSIVTLLIVATFCYLAIVGKVPAEMVSSVVGTVVAFYFLGKRRDGSEKENGGTST